MPTNSKEKVPHCSRMERKSQRKRMSASTNLSGEGLKTQGKIGTFQGIRPKRGKAFVECKESKKMSATLTQKRLGGTTKRADRWL